jgi:uncharacterized protein (TIRG00374 family)
MVGLLIFLLYLNFFVSFSDFVSAFEQANPIYYSLTFGALVLSVTFSSLTWQRLLNTLSVKASLRKAFQFIWIGYFVDLLIPGESVSSDVSRIYLMTKESGESAGKVTASVMGHRILSTIISFAGLMISSTYFALRYHPSSFLLEILVILAVASIVFLGALFYLSMRRTATRRIVEWLFRLVTWISRGRWRLDSTRSSAMKILRSFHDGIETLGRKPKALAMPTMLSIFAWLSDLLIVVLVFYSLGAFGTTVPFSVVVIVYFIIIGIEDIPLGIPAGVGLMEIVMTSLYALFGVPIGLSAAATVLIRTMTFWVKLLIGGVTVQWLGIKAFK